MYEGAALSNRPEVVGKREMGLKIRDLGNACEKESKPVKNIDESQERLSRSIVSLRGAIGELLGRCSPILRPEATNPCSDNMKDAPAPMKSPMADYLDRLTGEINSIRRDVDSALDRIEV